MKFHAHRRGGGKFSKSFLLKFIFVTFSCEYVTVSVLVYARASCGMQMHIRLWLRRSRCPLSLLCAMLRFTTPNPIYESSDRRRHGWHTLKLNPLICSIRPHSMSLIQSSRLFVRISVLPSVEYDLWVICLPPQWLTFIETKFSFLFKSQTKPDHFKANFQLTIIQRRKY